MKKAVSFEIDTLNLPKHMRIYILIVISILFFVRIGCATPIDSFLIALEQAEEDTNKVDLYLHIGDYYIITNLDSAIIYANQGVALARKLHYTRGIVQNLNVAASYHERKTAYPKAMKLYQEALTICEKDNYQKGLAVIINNIAIIHTRQAEYTKALELYFKALKVEEELDNQKGIAEAYNNIGIVYYYQRNIEKTLEYFEKSIVIEEALGDPTVLKKGYSNIGALYDYQQQYSNALSYYHKAYQLCTSLNDQLDATINLNNIALSHLKQGTQDSALFYQEKALKGYSDLGDYRGMAHAYSNFGQYYQKENNASKALAALNKALDIAQQYNLKEVEKELYSSFSTLYEAQQDYKTANAYINLYIQVKDSLINDGNTKALAEIEAKYQTAKQEKELLEKETKIDAQKQALHQKNIQIIAGLSIAFFVLLIGALLLYNQRLRNLQLKRDQELKDAKHQLETQQQLQAQRLSISRDLHDNIGAQLTFIISSVDNLKYGFKLENLKLLQKLKSISGFTRNTITDLRDTIWAMNLSHISLVDLQERIHAFINKAQDSSNITVNFNVAAGLNNNHQFNSVTGMNIYRIIQESVNNSLKYANATVIEVNITQAQQALKFTIKDNGIGFDPSNIVRGNGFNNMQKRAEEIQGSIQISSTPQIGTSVSFIVPEH